MPRLFLYTKDVQQLKGKGCTASQKLIAKIKKVRDKTRYEQITVTEFCNYTGLYVEPVLRQLGG